MIRRVVLVGWAALVVGFAGCGTNDARQLHGKWSLVEQLESGKPNPSYKAGDVVLVIDGDQIVAQEKGRASETARYTTDTSRTPHEIDIIPPPTKLNAEPRTRYGIFKVEGDRLTIYLTMGGDDSRPTNFTPTSNTLYSVFERIKN